MPAWEWILIAVIIVIAALAIFIATRMASSRKRTGQLKERFGPEYERTVRATGEQRAAEAELARIVSDYDTARFVALIDNDGWEHSPPA